MVHISLDHFTNRQHSATAQRTIQKRKIKRGSEFETDSGQSDVGTIDHHVSHPNIFLTFFINEVDLAICDTVAIPSQGKCVS